MSEGQTYQPKHTASICSNYTEELSINILFTQVPAKTVQRYLWEWQMFMFLCFLRSKAETRTDSRFVVFDSMISVLHLSINQHRQFIPQCVYCRFKDRQRDHSAVYIDGIWMCFSLKRVVISSGKKMNDMHNVLQKTFEENKTTARYKVFSPP